MFINSGPISVEKCLHLDEPSSAHLLCSSCTKIVCLLRIHLHRFCFVFFLFGSHGRRRRLISERLCVLCFHIQIHSIYIHSILCTFFASMEQFSRCNSPTFRLRRNVFTFVSINFALSPMWYTRWSPSTLATAFAAFCTNIYDIMCLRWTVNTIHFGSTAALCNGKCCQCSEVFVCLAVELYM